MEIPTFEKYYDGSYNLNVVDVDCFIHTVPNDCVSKADCGKLYIPSVYLKDGVEKQALA